jgi:uncharacterized membrane protein YgcG
MQTHHSIRRKKWRVGAALDTTVEIGVIVMKTRGIVRFVLGSLIACGFTAGCAEPGAPYDRPFPLGQVTDAHWDTQMTNAQASSFVFYDHEFIGDTAKLNVLGQSHLVQVALRLRHVPFPVVIEETPNQKNVKLDTERRQVILERLAELGLHDLECRVVIAPAIAEGLQGREAERVYQGSGRDIGGYGQGGQNGGFGGGGFGGFGGNLGGGVF